MEGFVNKVEYQRRKRKEKCKVWSFVEERSKEKHMGWKMSKLS